MQVRSAALTCITQESDNLTFTHKIAYFQVVITAWYQMCIEIRICGTSSRFGVPVNRLGLVMAHAELDALVRLVGPGIAAEIVLEGRVFDAAEAKDKGLVTRVVADGEVEAEAYAAARRIAAGAPLVARWHKQFLRRLADPRPLTEAEADEGFACFGTEDFATGYRAFLAKTEPEFKGR